MERHIKVGREFRTYVKEPLIADDIRAYKIVWDIKRQTNNMILMVTAKRADGVMVTDSGVFKDGVGEYVLAGNMYSVPGNVEIRVSVLENTSVLTEKILMFEVIEGNKTNEAVGAETNTPILDSLTIQIADLRNMISKIPTKTSQLTNDSGFITEKSNITKTSQLTNDSGFITEEDIPLNLSCFHDDIGVNNNKIRTDNLFESFQWEYTHNTTEKVATFILENTTDNLLTSFNFKGSFSGELRITMSSEDGTPRSFVVPENVEEINMRKNGKVYFKLQGFDEVTDITDDTEGLQLKKLRTFRWKTIIRISVTDSNNTSGNMEGCQFGFGYDKLVVPTKADLDNYATKGYIDEQLGVIENGSY